MRKPTVDFATALVTGAGGFIGGALTRRLAREGCHVWASTRRVDAYLDTPGVIRAPSDPDACRRTLGERPPEVVFHLAAYGVSPGERDPVQAEQVNVRDTVRWVDAAAAWKTRAFVYTGTSAEYGPAAAGERIAETHPTTGRGGYAATKAAGGRAASALAQSSGLPFIWLRLFGMYGPGEAAHRLAPSIAARLRAGEAAPLSAGTQIRDMMYVDDAVDGLIAAAGCDRSVANLCTGRPTSVRDFALTVAAVLGASPALLAFGALPLREDEPQWLVGSPAALADATGFSAGIAIREGLERMFAR